MPKVLKCGDLMPGCNTVIEGKDEAEVIAKGAEHARTAHNMASRCRRRSRYLFARPRNFHSTGSFIAHSTKSWSSSGARRFEGKCHPRQIDLLQVIVGQGIAGIESHTLFADPEVRREFSHSP